MNNIKFYDKYHKKNKNVQQSIISDSNFTYRYLLNAIKQVEHRSIRVLDIGCGVGTVDFWLGKKECSVDGYDISERAIGLANISSKAIGLSSKVKFENRDVTNISLPKNRYDLVICSEVIEHVEDDILLLKKIFSTLKKSGTLILSTPLKTAPLYKLGMLHDFDERVGHLRRYSQDEIISKTTEVGFKLQSFFKTEGILRNFLFTIPPFGFLLKFVRGPFLGLTNLLDDGLAQIFGHSGIYVIAKKL